MDTLLKARVLQLHSTVLEPVIDDQKLGLPNQPDSPFAHYITTKSLHCKGQFIMEKGFLCLK